MCKEGTSTAIHLEWIKNKFLKKHAHILEDSKGFHFLPLFCIQYEYVGIFPLRTF